MTMTSSATVAAAGAGAWSADARHAGPLSNRCSNVSCGRPLASLASRRAFSCAVAAAACASASARALAASACVQRARRTAQRD